MLLLHDEVPKYIKRAAAVSVLDSTLSRQAKDCFQNLTVEVAGSKSAALVYSLMSGTRCAGAPSRQAADDGWRERGSLDASFLGVAAGRPKAAIFALHGMNGWNKLRSKKTCGPRAHSENS